MFFLGHIHGKYSHAFAGTIPNLATGMERLNVSLAAYVCKGKGGHFTSYQLHFPRHIHVFDYSGSELHPMSALIASRLI